MNRILESILRTQRICNAYIFIDGSHDAMIAGARDFAKRLNCQSAAVGGSACGACPSCLKIEKNISPDLIKVERLKDKIKLSLEQMRALKDLVQYGPAESRKLVVMIPEADTMTLEAANSLLKLLEEPHPEVVFILICGREDALPRTIHSRCQKIRFQHEAAKPDIDPEKQWVYDEAKNISGKSLPHLLIFSQKLAGIKDRLEIQGVLYGLLVLFWQDLKTRQARIVMETVKNIKKNANIKLALDVMCLGLGEAK